MNEHSAASVSPDASQDDPRGHEPDAVHARLVTGSVCGLVLLVVFGLLVVHFLKVGLTISDTPRDPTSWGDGEGSPEVMADQPQQLRELHERENQQLSSYEWIDEDTGLARIPIERAMEILAQRGFDSTQSGDTTADSADAAGKQTESAEAASHDSSSEQTIKR